MASTTSGRARPRRQREAPRSPSGRARLTGAARLASSASQAQATRITAPRAGSLTGQLPPAPRSARRRAAIHSHACSGIAGAARELGPEAGASRPAPPPAAVELRARLAEQRRRQVDLSDLVQPRGLPHQLGTDGGRPRARRPPRRHRTAVSAAARASPASSGARGRRAAGVPAGATPDPRPEAVLELRVSAARRLDLDRHLELGRRLSSALAQVARGWSSRTIQHQARGSSPAPRASRAAQARSRRVASSPSLRRTPRPCTRRTRRASRRTPRRSRRRRAARP